MVLGQGLQTAGDAGAARGDMSVRSRTTTGGPGAGGRILRRLCRPSLGRPVRPEPAAAAAGAAADDAVLDRPAILDAGHGGGVRAIGWDARVLIEPTPSPPACTRRPSAGRWTSFGRTCCSRSTTCRYEHGRTVPARAAVRVLDPGPPAEPPEPSRRQACRPARRGYRLGPDGRRGHGYLRQRRLTKHATTAGLGRWALPPLPVLGTEGSARPRRGEGLCASAGWSAASHARSPSP